jgi:hypothetical protein
MNYPAQLRAFLQDQREAGVPFDAAWEAARIALPPATDWPYPEFWWNVTFPQTRSWWLKAYYGYALPGPDMASLMELLEEMVEWGDGGKTLHKAAAA